eukprot:6114624-Prymnesium_polylepis.1
MPCCGQPAAACLGAQGAVLWIAGRRMLRRARRSATDSRPPPAQACEVPCCRWPAAACFGALGAVLWIGGRRLLGRARCRAVGSRPPPA